MISFLKHDRPLTSQIRRKNYEIVGKQQMGEVDKYRSTAEQERVDLRHKNYEFYASLMTSLERCSQEDIPKTLTIL